MLFAHCQKLFLEEKLSNSQIDHRKQQRYFLRCFDELIYSQKLQQYIEEIIFTLKTTKKTHISRQNKIL